MVKKVFLNGKFIADGEAKISVLSDGLLCGFGLFETMRSYKGNIVHLDWHLGRLKKSAKLFMLKLPADIELRKAINKTVELNGFADAYVRLTCWKGIERTDISVIARRYTPFAEAVYRRGFHLYLSPIKQNEPLFLSRFKTTSRLLYEFLYQQAKDNGFDEVLILNSRGFVAEGSRSNLFIAKDKQIFTPGLTCGCLDGITRKWVFAIAREHKINIYQVNITLGDCYRSDEVFLTNSLMGIMPVTSIGPFVIAKGKVGNVTKSLIKKYNLLLKR